MGYKDDRYRSDSPQTFLGFIDILRKLWKNAGMPGDIKRQKPFDDELNLPLITFRIIRRLVNQDFKDSKPRYRDTIPHPHIDGEWIELYGQIFDVWVEFDIYSESQEEADHLVIELEEFLQLYKPFFKEKGVQELSFYSQGEDEVVESSRIMIAKRKLQYTVRIERVVPRFLNEIQDLAIQASILHINQDEKEEES